MVTEWRPKPSKSGRKKCFIFRSFFHRFLDRSWEPESLKMSTSCTREAHFHKIALSDSDILLEAKVMKKGSQNGPKMAKKINQKIRSLFDIDFGSIFGGMWEHFGSQNTIKNRVENLVFFWRSKNESWSRLWRSKGGPGVFGGQQACPEGAPGVRGQRALVLFLAPPNNLKRKNWWLWALGL